MGDPAEQVFARKGGDALRKVFERGFTDYHYQALVWKRDAKLMRDVVAASKAQPDRYTIGDYGHGTASRFRRADERPGIFYASEAEATAIAETAYWRLRFYLRSPGFVPPSATTEHTSFTAEVATAHAIDLTRDPFAADAALWTDPIDYSACQELGHAAREAGAMLIRTRSVRDSTGGHNVVVLAPEAFTAVQPAIRRTWHLRFEGGRLTALAAFPSEHRFVFTGADFGLT